MVTFEEKNVRYSFFNALDLCIFTNYRNKCGPKIYILNNCLFSYTCYDQHSKFSFLGKFHYTNFFWAKLLVAPKTPQKVGQFYLKAEVNSISEHPGFIPWPKNLTKKFLCKLWQWIFFCPKNINFVVSLLLYIT